MKTLFEHIAYAKKKPHHVRKRIAFVVATLCSGLVALVWLIGSFSLGSFAIQGSNFAESNGRPSADVVGRPAADVAGLAGAAAALPDANAPAHIEIVDTTTSTPVKDTTEQTTIPF